MAEAIWKLEWLLTEGGNLLSLHVSFYVLMVHMIIYLHGKESSSYSDPRSKNKSNKNTKAREQLNLKMRSSSMAMIDKTKKRKGMWYVEEVD